MSSLTAFHVVLGFLAVGAAGCVVDRVTARPRTPVRRAAADALLVGELAVAGVAGVLAWLWLG